jgi:hypothetical protein
MKRFLFVFMSIIVIFYEAVLICILSIIVISCPEAVIICILSIIVILYIILIFVANKLS